MTADHSGAVTLSQASGVREPNDLLRQARLRTPSPNDRTQPMSQRELAEAVSAHVFRTTARDVPLDRHYISRLERGRTRWPIADYRSGLRAVLGVATDGELGFYVKPKGTGPNREPQPPRAAPTSGASIQPVAVEVAGVQLVLSPGTAVVLVPVGRDGDLVTRITFATILDAKRGDKTSKAAAGTSLSPASG